jgi:hypothetical protein
MLCHDALALLTTKDTITRIKKEDQCGLLEDQIDFRQLFGRPIGDTPEIMN